jgi:hypothetical protein
MASARWVNSLCLGLIFLTGLTAALGLIDALFLTDNLGLTAIVF